MQDKIKKSRLNYIIYPSFQWILIISNFILIFLVAGITLFQTNQSYENLVQMGKRVKLPTNHPYFGFLNNQYENLYEYLSWALIISLTLSFLITLFISHKFAGPLVRLKNYFDEISKTGEIKELKFREGDYLSDLPEKVNNAFNKIKNN